jgi:hypothetical protein
MKRIFQLGLLIIIAWSASISATASSILVTWDKNTSDPDFAGNKVYHDIVTDRNGNVTIVPGNKGTYTISNVVQGVRYYVSVSAYDECQNESTKSTEHSIYVFDTIAPLISLNGDNPVYLYQGQAFNDQGVSVYDNVDSNLSNLVTRSGTVDTSVVGTYTLRYNVSDSAGNPAIEVTRTVVVKPLVPGHGISYTQVSGSVIPHDSTNVLDANPVASTPRTDAAKLDVPYVLKKSDVVRVSGSGFFEGQNANSKTCVAINTRDWQTWVPIASERNVIINYTETDFSIPLIISRDTNANGIFADIDMGLLPGHVQINDLNVVIERGWKVVTDVYVRRCIKPSALNTIGVELGWTAVLGADKYRVWVITPKDGSKCFDATTTSGSVTTMSINCIPLNDGVNILIAPIVNGVQQPENSLFYLPGNVVDRPSNGFMNCELKVNDSDKSYPGLHPNQIPVVTNSEGDDAAFADTDGNNVVGSGDNLRISNRAAAQTAAQTAGTPYPSLGRVK